MRAWIFAAVVLQFGCDKDTSNAGGESEAESESEAEAEFGAEAEAESESESEAESESESEAECDNSGDCNGCQGCAAAGPCAAERAACVDDNPECAAIRQCLIDCGTCYKECFTAHPDGSADFLAYTECIMCVCDTDCDQPSCK